MAHKQFVFDELSAVITDALELQALVSHHLSVSFITGTNRIIRNATGISTDDYGQNG